MLEIGRQMRHQMYDWCSIRRRRRSSAPGALPPRGARAHRRSGEVLAPLDEAAVARAADELVATGRQAIAICSCSRSSTPRTSAAPARSSSRDHPDVFVSLSSEVDPAFREYERTVVTAFDAYVKPVVDRYLADLEPDLPRPACLRRCRSCSRAAASRARRRARRARCGCFFRGRRPA